MKKVLFLSVLVVLASCGKDTDKEEEKQKEVTLYVSTSSVEADAAGGSQTFSISCSDTWVASSNQAWCTVQPAYGTGDATVAVTAEANPSTASRAAIITVAAGTLSQSVVVQQQAKKDVHTSFAITFDSYIDRTITLTYTLGGSRIESTIPSSGKIKSGYVFQEGESHSIEFYVFNPLLYSDKQVKKATLSTNSYGIKFSFVRTVTHYGVTNNNYTHYYTLDLTQLNEATLDKDHPDGKVDLTITLE